MQEIDEDAAYIAYYFKRGIYYEKKKKHKGEGYRLSNSMRISMEITMTDHSVLIWLHEVLGVGTLRPKTVKGRRKDGTKYLKQYKWRCTFRDAYQVCLLIWPFAHTKLPKIQQIIEHYSTEKLKCKIMWLTMDEYRAWRKDVRQIHI